MSDLLFLAHRIPYPPNKGDKIRSWNFLRHLAQSRRVHLGCFIDDPADREHVAVLRDICGECCFVDLQPRRSRLLSTRGLLTGDPLTLPYYASSTLSAWVRGVVERFRPQQLFFFSAAMAQFDVPTPYPARRVIDIVDVDSQKWAEYAERQRWPLSWVYAREGRTLLRFERETARRMDASLFVSLAETQLFATLAPESAGRLHAVNNGVDTEYFSPDRPYETPFPAGTRALVFTGAMDYWPNIDAVVHFAETMLPAIRQAVPDTSFWIVGSSPARAVTDLAARPGVVVTGRVPDVRPYLAHAAAVVAPLRIARGVQNKVLEAMAMAKTVIATPQAAEGIDGREGRDLLVPRSSDAFVQACVHALRGGVAGDIGAHARSYVLATYNWQKSLYKLDLILDGEAPRERPMTTIGRSADMASY